VAPSPSPAPSTRGTRQLVEFEWRHNSVPAAPRGPAASSCLEAEGASHPNEGPPLYTDRHAPDGSRARLTELTTTLSSIEGALLVGEKCDSTLLLYYTILLFYYYTTPRWVRTILLVSEMCDSTLLLYYTTLLHSYTTLLRDASAK
jgi:hypothetical protein